MVKEQREEHKMKKLRVGVIGIGDISNVYLNNLKKYDAVEVVACASRGLEKAKGGRARYSQGIRLWYGADR